MKNIFLIRKKNNGQFFNKKNEWSDSILSYRLKEFNSKEEAQAAIPEGIDCTIVRFSKQDEMNSLQDTGLKFRYYLQDLHSKCFLNASNQFKVWAAIMPEALYFQSEDAALDKAEDLGLSLDSIRVVRLMESDKDK